MRADILSLFPKQVFLLKGHIIKALYFLLEFKRRYLCKGDKQQLFRFCKITHPSYNEGAKVVTLTLKILDKTDGKTVLGTRDYVLYIETKLATYSLDVTAKNEKGEIIDDAKVSVLTVVILNKIRRHSTLIPNTLLPFRLWDMFVT